MRAKVFKGALLSTFLIASLLSPIFLISPKAAWGQEIGWTSQFGTSSTDFARSIAVDASGNVYIAGYTSGALPGQTSSGGRDAFVRKYDGSANELWTSQFGTPNDDSAYGVAVDTSSNVYIAGETRGALLGQTSSGGRDAFVRKYDGSGSELWTKQFGTSSTDFARSIAVDASGNVYVAGETWGALPGYSYAGGGDAFVRKYDVSGNELWTKQFGTSITDSGYGVAVDASGNIYVVGHTGGTLLRQTSSGGDDAFIRKYDGKGNELWTRQFGTSITDFAQEVAVDALGNVYVAGETRGALLWQTSSGGIDAFVRKYDGSANELWTSQFGTPNDDSAYGVAVDTSGNVYVAGETWGALPGQTSSGGRDAFVREYDESENELWTKQFGTSSMDFARGVAVDTSDNVYVAGYTFGALPGHSSAGEGDILLVKFVQIAAPPSDISIELVIAIAIGCSIIIAALYMIKRKTRK